MNMQKLIDYTKEKVCECYRISTDELMSDSRIECLSQARGMIVVLLVDMGVPKPIFAPSINRSRSNCYCLEKTTRNAIEIYPSVREQYQLLLAKVNEQFGKDYIKNLQGKDVANIINAICDFYELQPSDFNERMPRDKCYAKPVLATILREHCKANSISMQAVTEQYGLGGLTSNCYYGTRRQPTSSEYVMELKAVRQYVKDYERERTETA